MKIVLHKVLAVLLVVGLAAPVGEARATQPHAANPVLRREVRDYLKTRVMPVLRQQRQKLEPELAPADQAQLATYRAQLKELGQRAQALRSAGPTATRPPAADSAATVLARRPQSSALQSVRAERREIMRHVAQLAQKYQANLTRLAEEIQPQQAQWKTDLQAIVAKNSTAEQQTRLAHRHERSARFGSLHKLMKASMFLLMDPGTAAPVGTSLYPNPVAATSQLQYEVKQAGPVTIELLDKTGTTLRPVVRAAQQAKGSHTQPIDLADLPSGTYYYKIATPTGTETKRFVKE